MYYIELLAEAHRRLSPATYLEIGIRDGRSLALARTRSVAIDPDFAIKAELNCDVTLFRTTSDEYFARPDPLAPTGGRPFDLSFIDGLHLFEYVLRDFINAERHASPRGMIFFDDILPRTVDEAARRKHTLAWTGDVYPIVEVLTRYRPDLTVLPIDVRPTGLLLVTGLDPASKTLLENYDEIIAEYVSPDPQPVPDELLNRLATVDPDRVLASSLWGILAGARPEDGPIEIRERLATALGAELGAAWGPRETVATSAAG